MSRPPIPTPPYGGGCLCGAVRYEITARPNGVNACHCTDCKKLTGATHLLMLLLNAKDFSATGETQRWRKKADSGREIDIVRCAQCGVRLWHEPLSAPELVFVAAGTLDDPKWAQPASHIWVRSISPGILVDFDAYTCDAQPATRDELAVAFKQIYG